MSECRYCGAMIRFEETANGKMMPVDKKAVYYEPDDNGPTRILNMRGEIVRGYVTPTGNCVGCIPHFATCRHTVKRTAQRRRDIREFRQRQREAKQKKLEREAQEAAKLRKRIEQRKREWEEQKERDKQLSFL